MPRFEEQCPVMVLMCKRLSVPEQLPSWISLDGSFRKHISLVLICCTALIFRLYSWFMPEDFDENAVQVYIISWAYRRNGIQFKLIFPTLCKGLGIRRPPRPNIHDRNSPP